MALLKNVHLVTDIVKPDDIDKMEHAALQHKRYSNKEFKVVDVKPSAVIIQAAQGKSAAENYATGKRLIEIVRETFGRFFPDHKINVQPIPYKVPAAYIVDDKWINAKMLGHGIKAKEISEDTGIDRTQLTALVNGTRPLSKPMKALFWYYFLAKK